MTRHHIVVRSSNRKVGKLTVTRTTTETCPRSCPLLGQGCYDQGGNGRIHRDKVDRGEYRTASEAEFLADLPNFTSVFRHNEGGDLWNSRTNSEGISPTKLKRFATACKDSKRTAIIYTHKPLPGQDRYYDEAKTLPIEYSIKKANLRAIKQAKAAFAINASCDSLKELDQVKSATGLDCVVVLPKDHKPRTIRTKAGNRVITCPATYGKTTCETCGNGSPLCTRKGRGYSIGFPAHGSSAKKISKRLAIVNND